MRPGGRQAFLLPQSAAAAGSLKRARTSIDEIERLTGFDFLHELDDAVETDLESRRSERMWEVGAFRWLRRRIAALHDPTYPRKSRARGDGARL